MTNNSARLTGTPRTMTIRMSLSILASFFLAAIVFVTIKGESIVNFIAFIAVFFGLFHLFTMPMLRYFRVLTTSLKTISAGNLSCRIPQTRRDELGDVARSINDMAEQLQRQQERERQSERSKMELITNVSHDLRTPLTSLIGYLDLLRNRTYEDEQEREKYIATAYNKTQQLKRLIDDLFEYTRLTEGKVKLEPNPVELNSLLEQVVTEFEPVAREQRTAVTLRHAAGPVMARVDAEQLVRAIDNLLMNALKFSPRPGEIRVAVETEAGGKTARLIFENDGPPITKEQEAQLFERFYKTEPSRNDGATPSGSGLGLTIARQIVELSGGNLTLRQDNGRYSFAIELPVAVSA